MMGQVFSLTKGSCVVAPGQKRPGLRTARQRQCLSRKRRWKHKAFLATTAVNPQGGEPTGQRAVPNAFGVFSPAFPTTTATNNNRNNKRESSSSSSSSSSGGGSSTRHRAAAEELVCLGLLRKLGLAECSGNARQRHWLSHTCGGTRKAKAVSWSQIQWEHSATAVSKQRRRWKYTRQRQCLSSEGGGNIQGKDKHLSAHRACSTKSTRDLTYDVRRELLRLCCL